MKQEIKLLARGDINNRLVQVEGNPLKYELKTDYNYRVGFKEGNSDEYEFIDPAGGPFIMPGSIIEGHKVKAIYADAIIEFEE